MGKVKISALPDGGKLQNNEVLVGNRNGITYKFSAWLMPGLNTPYIITAAYADTTIDQNILLLQGGTAQQITVPEPSMFPPQFMNNTAIKVYNQGSNAALLFTQSPTYQWQEYSIVGNIDNPPTYALNSTHIPTLTNASIVANKVVASANAASATTWNYSTGAVTQIIPYVVFTPTALTIDPSSTTGSIKVNYTTNNLLQVGSKVLVTDGGVTTEETIAAGSQATLDIFDSGWGTLLALGIPSGKLFLVGQSNGKIAVSTDDGQNWQYAGQPIVGAVYESAASIVEFGGNYYSCWGVTGQTTVTIFKSVDLLNWTSVYTYSATIARKAHLATNGTILRVVFFGALSESIYMYGSNDGATWSSITTFSGVSNQYLYGFMYQNGKWLLAANSKGYFSNDGTSYTTYSAPILGGLLTLGYINSLYVMYTYENYGSGIGIYSSPNFSIWTFRQSVSLLEGNYFFFNSDTIFLAGHGSTTIFSSTNGTSWTTQTTLSINAFNGGSTDDAIVVGVKSSQNINYKYQSNAWTNGATASGYQFTITSPSLPVPDAMYLGGQSLSYSVSTTITPSYTNATLTYVDNAGVITATGAQDVATGNNVMLKFEGMNSGESMQEIGAALYIRSQEGITLPQNKVMTLTPYKSQYEVDAYYYLIDIADTP